MSLKTRQWSDSIEQNAFGADEDNEPFMAVGPDIRAKICGEVSRMFGPDARPRDERRVQPKKGLAWEREVVGRFRRALTPPLDSTRTTKSIRLFPGYRP